LNSDFTFFASERAAEPLVIQRVLRLERDRLFSLLDGIVPVAHFVVGAAEPVIQISVRGARRHGCLQRGDRACVIPRIDLVLRRLNRGGCIGPQRLRRKEESKE
jgi:hypothetical protein